MLAGMKILWIAVLAFGRLWAAEPSLQLDLGGASLELVFVPAGEFSQGSPSNEIGRADDEVVRNVRLTAGFYMGRTAVTRGQWEAFVQDTGYRSEAEVGASGGYGWDGVGLSQRKEFTWRNPGFKQTSEHPVCLVTFSDANAFCLWVERKSGWKTSLPTESQWEYACRATTTTPWHGGGPESTDQIAWHKGNSGSGTQVANSRKPNLWGLVIGGNVAEWCLDWYGPYDVGAISDPLQTLPNLSDKPRRVLRGGSWLRDAKNTRSAARFRSDPRSRNADIGFRIVCANEISDADLTIPPIPPALPVPADDPPVVPLVDTQAPAGGASVFSLPGLICLLLPVGLIVLLIRFVARGRNKVSPFVTLPTANVPKSGLARVLRTGADGFWIQSDEAVGTSFQVRYSVDGVMSEQAVVYQPGPEGQFVFTGGLPNNIVIFRTSQRPPPTPRRSMRNDDDDDFHRRQRISPPIFPSAY